MPDVTGTAPHGVLRDGWQTSVPDYPLGLAYSLDGGTLFVVDAAGTLHALDGATGGRRWTATQAHSGGAMALAHHPHAQRLATSGHDGLVRVWDAVSGAGVHELVCPARWVDHLAWSPDGAWLAAACGRQVLVWDAQGALVWCCEPQPSTVSAIGWSAQRELATACFGRVAFWSLPDGAQREALEWQGSLVSMALSPDGEIVACGSQDNTVHFWRRSTGHDSMMSGYAAKPSALAFDATGTFLATGGGMDVTVWSFADGGPEGTRPGVLSLHPALVTSLRFAHRGPLLASGGREGGVVTWRLDGQGGGAPSGGGVARGAVEGLAWRPDDRALAAIDSDGGVTTWRVRR